MIARKAIDPYQNITTRFYCVWDNTGKKYFQTLTEALEQANSLYTKKHKMSKKNFAFWLMQKQLVGMETVIDTPICHVFSSKKQADKHQTETFL